MARGNRGGKKGGWAGAGGANTKKKGQKSDGTTSYEQKAFGKGQLIDRVFKESNVLRDSSGKFIDKPGRGKPPKARVLDGHRPGETEQKKFKQMQDVSKSVKAREKSAKELDEYRLNLARESIKQEILTKVNSSARLATVANSKQIKSLEELIQSRKTDLEINSDYDKLKSEYSDRQVKAYTESLLLQGVSDKDISARVTRFKQGILEVDQSDSSLEIQGLLKTISLAEGVNDSPEDIIKGYKRLNKELNEETIKRAISMAEEEDTVRDEYLFYRAREERRKALTTLSRTEERETSKEAVGKRKEETSSALERKKQLSDELKKLKLELKGDKSEEAKEKLKEAKSKLDVANGLYKEKKEDSDKDKGSNELKTLGFRDITEVKREGFIGDTTKRARVVTPGTEETIAKRISSLEEIYGKKTLSALMENMDVVSISPKNMNTIQANLINSLYSVRQRNNTLSKDTKLITWGNLSKDLTQDEINSFIGGWARKQEIKNYIGNANWSNKKATEGSIYTSDKRNKAGEKLVSSWAKEGNYSRNLREEPETKELANKVHDYIKGGMRKNYKNAVDKAVTEATEAARNQGTPLSDAEIKEITREAKKEAMVKLINMEEILNGEADIEKFQGRVIVNPATELPREIIKNLPDGALNYLVSKYENQVGRKVKTSVVYNELLHGNFEEDVSQKDSSRIKFETHHIEQFMYRVESGEPVIVYDSFKSGGKLRTMVHSDMDKLYAEEVEGELLYYVKSKKGTSEVKSYLARSPYEDETGVEIREDGRVLKNAKESVSPIKEQLGTNEPYIDLRGSTHQNKEFLYSMLHPGTTLKNDDKLNEQINNIDRIASITGNKPVSSLYKDKDIKFFSMGVGAEERKSHERLKSKLEAIRKLETLNELRREREIRREINPEEITQQEKLGKFGHAQRLKKSEEQNVKSVGNRVDDLLLLKAAYNAFDAPQSTKDRLGKLLDKTVTQAAKAKRRLIDVDNKIEELETNYGDLIKTKFDARVHSEKFLEETMYEADTWGILIEGKITENRMREAIIKNGKS